LRAGSDCGASPRRAEASAKRVGEATEVQVDGRTVRFGDGTVGVRRSD
jgi:hypothetical protein